MDSMVLAEWHCCLGLIKVSEMVDLPVCNPPPPPAPLIVDFLNHVEGNLGGNQVHSYFWKDDWDGSIIHCLLGVDFDASLKPSSMDLPFAGWLPSLISYGFIQTLTCTHV